MNDAPAHVDTDSLTAEEDVSLPPGPNTEDASEAATANEEPKKRTRKHTKPRCPFLIEVWEPQDGGAPADGRWALVLGDDVTAFKSTQEAIAYVRNNMFKGDFRIIQVRDEFTALDEPVTKTTIMRG